MIAVEIIFGIMMILLGIVTSISDLKEGRVYNKTLLVFSIIAVILCAIYYGYFARDLLMLFLINFGTLAAISLFLFYSHSFAGGDCKLVMVMGLLYPANFYLVYGQSSVTVFFTIGAAIFYGYIYLLISAVLDLVKKKNVMSKDYIKGYLLAFVKSFVSATVYISMVNLALLYLQGFGIVINPWLVRILCIVIAWIVGKIPVLKKWFIVVAVLAADIIIGIGLGYMPFSLNPENYILVVVLLLCQMTIRTNIYEEVKIENLEKGMILASFSSMLMQNSRVRGLPDVSTEDLRSRLTEDEVSSIKRWAASRKVESLAVVKKIPFALFIFLGFVSYFGLWSIVR